MWFAYFSPPQRDLNAQVTLYLNANITVHQRGVVEFSQVKDSDTKGGIAVAAGGTSKIDNYGTIRRTREDQDNKTLQIQPKVTSQNPNAVLEVGGDCRINFAGTYDVTQGANLKKGANSRIGGLAGLDGGKISLEDPGIAGLYDTYFDDSVIANSGIIEFVQTTPGAYGRVNIEGNFVLAAGATIDNFHVKSGAAVPANQLADLFVVGGAVTLGGTLHAVATSDFVGGSPVTVINKTSPGPVTGTFADLDPGDEFRLGNWMYEITYTGGDGNDVVLLPVAPGQWANCVNNFSSEFNASPGTYSAAQALNNPNTFSYGDKPTAWSPAAQNGTQEFITLCFPNNVYAQGVTVREINGNGFVTQVDLLDTNDVLHPIWSGTDPSQPGSPAELTLSFGAVNFLVKGVKVYVNTNHNLNTFEQIDAIILYGETGGGLAPLTGGTGLAGALASLRVSGLARPNVGPFATFGVSGPVALGVPVTFLFSNPRGGSGYRYSFDFNNDGDFSDPGERADGTSPSAQHTFTTRGWHVVRGRIRSADGRFTDFWVRVFIP